MSLSASVNDIKSVVRTIVFRNLELSTRVSSLESENASLRERLSKYESPAKDSHNSSTPPSQESLRSQAIRRTRTLRKSSGRLSGGQPGHKGSTLLMKEDPDEIQTHAPQYCTSCGGSLGEIPAVEEEVRQSIDIPLPVCPVVTNHVLVSKKCTCGHCQRGEFPVHVKPGVSYGVNIHALVAYLSTVQHIPFKRLTDVLKDFYGLELSQGSISNILNRMRKQSTPVCEAIRSRG